MKNTKSAFEARDYYDVTDNSLLDGIANRLSNRLKSVKPLSNVIVTIPAHNEAEIIGACIESLASQETMFNVPMRMTDFEVLILCHKCTDNTYMVCEELKSKFPTLNLHVLQTSNPLVNNVGAVRRILMNIAKKRLKNKDGYIACTDADTSVDKFWIANLMGYIGSGYGMICGKIDIDMTDISRNIKRTLMLKNDYFSLVREIEHKLVPHVLNPSPRHSDNSGPNLAIRGDVYSAIGGIQPIGFCEDIALYDAVLYNGFQVRHCLKTIVKTSSRTDTRAPWGFGAELRNWDESNEVCFEVESLKEVLARLKIRKLVTDYFRTSEKSLLTKIQSVSLLETKIENFFNTSASETAVIHKIEKTLEKDENWRKKYPKQPVSVAYYELIDYLKN